VLLPQGSAADPATSRRPAAVGGPGQQPAAIPAVPGGPQNRRPPDCIGKPLPQQWMGSCLPCAAPHMGSRRPPDTPQLCSEGQLTLWQLWLGGPQGTRSSTVPSYLLHHAPCLTNTLWAAVGILPGVHSLHIMWACGGSSLRRLNVKHWSSWGSASRAACQVPPGGATTTSSHHRRQLSSGLISRQPPQQAWAACKHTGSAGVVGALHVCLLARCFACSLASRWPLPPPPPGLARCHVECVCCC
jgi:hypothetical protein